MIGLFNRDLKSLLTRKAWSFPLLLPSFPIQELLQKTPYFLTELQGRVRVITNDRSAFTFAENLFIPPPNLGMTGICLDPKHGYVFVTFSHLDSGIHGNVITRF